MIADGSKRLLAIDGGGIRGVIALKVLERIENLLRLESGRPDLTLGQYFDYIAGTSTGAIIAAGLSYGLSIGDMIALYRVHGADIFRPAPFYRYWYYRYDPRGLESILRQTFGEATTLGSDRLKTLLMMVLHNATTDSPWPLSSNPQAMFNQRHDNGGRSNLDLPLWQLVRASAAAPLFFPPMEISIGHQTFLFMDGGVTPYNNPAYLLYLMATLPCYRLEWPTGAQRMLLVSVGTGRVPADHPAARGNRIGLLSTATKLPLTLIGAGIDHQDLSCRAIGHCLHGDLLDAEVGDLVSDSPSADAKFSYVRYNLEISERGLRKIGSRVDPRRVSRMDAVEAVPALIEIGQALAEGSVRADHFRAFPGCGRQTHDPAGESFAGVSPAV